MIRDKEFVIEKLNAFINSDNKSCLVVGTNVQEKHKNIIAYLNGLGKALKILVRIDSMQNSEYILGYKAKTGVPKKIGNLTIYVDSLQSKSQENTHKNFNCILVYPIAALKGIDDDNIIDIANDRNSEKIFWISNHDSVDYSYLKAICDIKDIIEINNGDDVIHNRIVDNIMPMQSEKFDKLLINNLSYFAVEEALDRQYKLGGIYTSSMGQELVVGYFNKYIFGGHRATKSFFIKVLQEKENDKYVLLVKQSKK